MRAKLHLFRLLPKTSVIFNYGLLFLGEEILKKNVFLAYGEVVT
jgi:hypothetical protein